MNVSLIERVFGLVERISARGAVQAVRLHAVEDRLAALDGGDSSKAATDRARRIVVARGGAAGEFLETDRG